MTLLSPLLETKALSIGISNKTFCKHLDLCVYPGECVGIIGRNGAGKSTLLSTLAGIRPPQSGEILLEGQTYQTLGIHQSALIRGWLPQSRGDAFASTVIETTMVGRHPHVGRWNWESKKDLQIVRQSLAQMDMSAFEQRDIQTLSGGERQRVAIATLLAQSPKLYLLDEPTAYLDLKHQMQVLSLFSDLAQTKNAGVVMILHDPSLAWRFCNRILFVYGDGKTEIGPNEEMLTAERLSMLYEYPLKRMETDNQVSFIPA